MKRLFQRVLRDDRSSTAIEYGLLAALIGVAIIPALVLLRAAAVRMV